MMLNTTVTAWTQPVLLQYCPRPDVPMFHYPGVLQHGCGNRCRTQPIGKLPVHDLACIKVPSSEGMVMYESCASFRSLIINIL